MLLIAKQRIGLGLLQEWEKYLKIVSADRHFCYPVEVAGPASRPVSKGTLSSSALGLHDVV
jgi:hypothetical protein